MQRLTIVIPCYNEVTTVGETIRRVLAADLGVEREVIVVDDGSTDGTIEEIKKYPSCQLVVQEKNEGKGAALRAGFLRATGDFVVVQDADLEYDPKDLRRLVEKAVEGHVVIYGSRRLGKARNPSAGRFFYAGGVFLSWLANILYGTRLTDEATCYKMFRRDLLHRISLRCTRFEFCPELTAKVSRSGERIVEVPISYAPRSRAAGKKINWKDGLDAIWTLLRYRFWRPQNERGRSLLVLTQAVAFDDPNLGFFHNWIMAAAARATTVTVLAQRVGRFTLSKNVTVRTMGPGPKVLRYARLLWWCFREIPKHDAVFCHMAPEYALIAGPFARIWYRRIGLWYVHKSVTRRLGWALRLVDVVFTASRESFRLLSPKVRIMGHGIPLDVFSPGTQPLPTSPLRLLAVGRLTQRKGLHVLLHALAELRRCGVADVRLTIVGDAYVPADRTYAAEMRALAETLDVASLVDWRGNVSYADLPSLYRAHHALLHASETGSVDKVVLEALASGCMVFSSSEAFTGLLPERFCFVKGDAASLAQKIFAARGCGADAALSERVRAEYSLERLWERLSEDLFLYEGNNEECLPVATIPASAVILTYNSAATLQKTIDSVRAFQEVLIVDGGSTDATLEIARVAGCRIISQQDGSVGPIQDFSAVRIRAVAAASHDWVFIIDSDEIATPRLVRAIAQAVTTPPAAYWVDRRYVDRGHTVHVAATYPNRQARFFHRAVFERYVRKIHERPVFRTTERGFLDGWMLVPLQPASALRQKWLAQARILLTGHAPASFGNGLYYGTRELLLGLRHLLRALWYVVTAAPKRIPFAYEAARLPYYWTVGFGLWKAALFGARRNTPSENE
jgi:glycosyltransferase involved in cell wall biosynthesis